VSKVQEVESVATIKKVSSVMGRDNNWSAAVPVVVSYSLSEAVHTTMYTTKQTVPVECLDW